MGRSNGKRSRAMKARVSSSARALVVDLFCGAGGLSYGFKLQSFTLAASVDIDEGCRYPHEANNKAPFLREDIEALGPEELDRLFVPGQNRVLVGCAPCQPFSTYNQKNNDPSCRLLQSFSALINAVRPEVVSMENVPRLLRFNEGTAFLGFVDALYKAGYQVVWDVLYGPDFGVAQTRSRLVLLASRLGPITLPQPTYTAHHRTVKDEIGDLPPIRSGERDESDALHCASSLSETNLRRIAAATPGGTWRDWHDDLIADCHKAKTGKGTRRCMDEWSGPNLPQQSPLSFTGSAVAGSVTRSKIAELAFAKGPFFKDFHVNTHSSDPGIASSSKR
jgi:DNA (cytosine-5)-methyltransferase 1